jgi:hypothetical protein
MDAAPNLYCKENRNLILIKVSLDACRFKTNRFYNNEMHKRVFISTNNL